MSYLDDAAAKTEEFEGKVPWMYLDTRGIVTVGNGRALFELADALVLPFTVDGRKATSEEIGNEFEIVKRLRPGMVPAKYRDATSLELDGETIKAMLYSKMHEVDGVLRARLDGYDAMPDGVKVPLLDMAYNLGPNGLLAQYAKHFIPAVKAGDWVTAANECFRHGPSAERNEWTKEQFLQAAKVGTHA